MTVRAPDEKVTSLGRQAVERRPKKNAIWIQGKGPKSDRHMVWRGKGKKRHWGNRKTYPHEPKGYEIKEGIGRELKEHGGGCARPRQQLGKRRVGGAPAEKIGPFSPSPKIEVGRQEGRSKRAKKAFLRLMKKSGDEYQKDPKKGKKGSREIQISLRGPIPDQGKKDKKKKE